MIICMANIVFRGFCNQIISTFLHIQMKKKNTCSTLWTLDNTSGIFHHQSPCQDTVRESCFSVFCHSFCNIYMYYLTKSTYSEYCKKFSHKCGGYVWVGYHGYDTYSGGRSAALSSWPGMSTWMYAALLLISAMEGCCRKLVHIVSAEQYFHYSSKLNWVEINTSVLDLIVTRGTGTL